MQAADLIAFEADIAREFDAGNVHAPVHLSGGNEQQLIDIFRDVRPEDYVFSTWRSHYHALLKGIPPAEVKRQIMAGRSMFISSVEHRFYASSIMGGTLPIACGVAAEVKDKYLREGGILNRHITDPMPKVWCFIGDMCSRTGHYADAARFASARNLNLTIVIEDNGLATNTPTDDAWGIYVQEAAYLHYHYDRTYPHYQPYGHLRGF